MNLLKRAEMDGPRFLNPVPVKIGGVKMIFRVLPRYLAGREEREPRQPLGPFRTDPDVYKSAPESGLRVTWFGHSSSLIEIDGFRVLLDPVWEQRASPFRWMGPKRFFPPTLALNALPRLDVVLLSHDHYDHLGEYTVRQLARLEATAGARWITSLGVGRHLRRFGVPAARISELDWTQSVEISQTVEISQSVEISGRGTAGPLRVTAWPARHFSGRGTRDRFKTLWSSFVIEGPRHRVYFGADTGWWDGFAEIAEHYASEGGFDLTMLEIGAFHELWADIHLGPDGAVQAFEAMGGAQRAGFFLPIHWGLFNLALHAWRQPIERLLELASSRKLALLLPEPGQPTEVPGNSDRLAQPDARSQWWNPTLNDVQNEKLVAAD